jgi:predicted acylesterase/phospholipase RssA
MKRTLLLGGGVFRCYFQLPIIRKLVCEQVYDYVCGVGLGSFNGAMVSVGKTNLLQSCWDGGLFSRSWWLFGPYTHNRLRKLLYQHVAPSRLGTEFQCGHVAMSGFTYVQPIATHDSDRRWMHDQILASCSTSGIVAPLVQNGDSTIDGSHMLGLPKIPFESSDIDVIMTQPLKGAFTLDKSDKNIGVVAGQLHRNGMNSLEFLRQWRRHPANSLTVYAPKRQLGGMFDSSREAMAMRLQMGEESAKTPLQL